MTDKKNYSLDDIKPMSAMSIEPIDPIIGQYLDFDSVFGKEGSPTDLRSKGDFIREKYPTAHVIPTPAEFNDLLGLPQSVTTKSQAVIFSDSDAVSVRKAKVERDDHLGLPSF